MHAAHKELDEAHELKDIAYKERKGEEEERAKASREQEREQERERLLFLDEIASLESTIQLNFFFPPSTCVTVP